MRITDIIDLQTIPAVLTKLIEDLDAFEREDISFPQLCKSLKLSKIETMKFLETMNISLTDYDIEEELKGIEGFLELK